MALKKKVTAKNGIVTEYHRIAMISVEVNQQNTILLYSYLSEDGRQIEKDYADYDGTMTIVKAYEYLKTLPEFEGAEDV